MLDTMDQYAVLHSPPNPNPSPKLPSIDIRESPLYVDAAVRQFIVKHELHLPFVLHRRIHPMTKFRSLLVNHFSRSTAAYQTMKRDILMLESDIAQSLVRHTNELRSTILFKQNELQRFNVRKKKGMEKQIHEQLIIMRQNNEARISQQAKHHSEISEKVPPVTRVVEYLKTIQNTFILYVCVFAEIASGASAEVVRPAWRTLMQYYEMYNSTNPYSLDKCYKEIINVEDMFARVHYRAVQELSKQFDKAAPELNLFSQFVPHEQMANQAAEIEALALDEERAAQLELLDQNWNAWKESFDMYRTQNWWPQAQMWYSYESSQLGLPPYYEKARDLHDLVRYVAKKLNEPI